MMDHEKEGVSFSSLQFPITAMREIKILKRLNHPNILRILEIVYQKRTVSFYYAAAASNEQRSSVYLVFELMTHDLAGVFDFRIQFTPPQIKNVLSQILFGLKYLHENQIMHRDIKGANILMNNKGMIKLADFGLSRQFIKPKSGNYPGMTNRVVTLWYRAPELLLGDTKYGLNIDVWSVGCFMYELFSGKPLF